MVYVNATNLLFSLQAGLPAAKIAVIGPQWPRTPSPVGDSNVFNCGILLSNACSVCAVPYISPISPPWITGNVAIPNSGNADMFTRATDGWNASDGTRGSKIPRQPDRGCALAMLEFEQPRQPGGKHLDQLAHQWNSHTGARGWHFVEQQ